MKHVLFVCSRNRLRSPTAEEAIFAGLPDLGVASAGLDNDADVVCMPEMLKSADIVFVMDSAHRTKLTKRFQRHLGKVRVICLDIPDKYEFMQPELVRLLQTRVGRHLRLGGFRRVEPP